MQLGDTFTDTQGAGWVLDRLMGRGSWGETWLLRGDEGAIAVLKAPLLPSHFGESSNATTLAAACTSIASAHKALLAERAYPFLPELLATALLDDGREALVLRHYIHSVEDRLIAGLALSDVLDVAVSTLHQLANGAPGGVVHGNLRPSNILLDDHGGIVLTDMLVDVARTHRSALEAVALGRASYRPPEASFHPEAGWDTWAVCCVLFRASSSANSSDDPRRGPVVPLPKEGLDKVLLASARDGAAARLRSEAANARFAGRATDKLGAVLNRGLSAQTDPSPPFRFLAAEELRARLVEVHELVHPTIEAASRVMLGTSAINGVFEGQQDVGFSVNVGATAGVTGHEDIAVGVNLRDLDAPGDGRVRITDSRFHVDRYPSGKWRFNFELPSVPPGRYNVRVAFAVKGTEGPPTVSEGEFEVRPKPGYVPPPTPETAPPPPIRFPASPPPVNEAAAEVPTPTFQPTQLEEPEHVPDTVVSEPVAPPPTHVSPPGFAAHASAVAPVAPPVMPPSTPVPAPIPTVRPGPKDPPAAPKVVQKPGPLPAGTPPPITEPPSVIGDAHAGLPPLPDPGALQDYPFPTGAGSDLPGYDGADPSGGTSLDALKERFVQAYEEDAFSVIIGIAVLAFILVVCINALLGASA